MKINITERRWNLYNSLYRRYSFSEFDRITAGYRQIDLNIKYFFL